MAGAVFEGFTSLTHGPISFKDLNSKLENADFRSVDDTAADHLAGDSDSNYALTKSNARILPFGKLIGNPGMWEIFWEHLLNCIVTVMDFFGEGGACDNVT